MFLLTFLFCSAATQRFTDDSFLPHKEETVRPSVFESRRKRRMRRKSFLPPYVKQYMSAERILRTREKKTYMVYFCSSKTSTVFMENGKKKNPCLRGIGVRTSCPSRSKRPSLLPSISIKIVSTTAVCFTSAHGDGDVDAQVPVVGEQVSDRRVENQAVAVHNCRRNSVVNRARRRFPGESPPVPIELQAVGEVFRLFSGSDEENDGEELLVALVLLLLLQDQHEVVAEARLHHHPVHRARQSKHTGHSNRAVSSGDWRPPTVREKEGAAAEVPGPGRELTPVDAAAAAATDIAADAAGPPDPPCFTAPGFPPPAPSEDGRLMAPSYCGSFPPEEPPNERTGGWQPPRSINLQMPSSSLHKRRVQPECGTNNPSYSATTALQQKLPLSSSLLSSCSVLSVIEPLFTGSIRAIGAMKLLCSISTVYLLLFCLPVCLAAHGRYAQKLMTDLFSNYTNALRPVEDTDHIINVTLQITLSQIIDMDERNQILTTYLWVRQVWNDAYLTWKKEDYDGLDTIRIPSSYVWRPDIVLYNSADDEFSSSMETNVVISHDGQIMWDQPAITKSSCSVDVAFFPFDLQQCHLTFGSWTHNGNQMDLFNALDTADLADFVPNVEWEVLGMPAKKNVILYGCCSDPYPDITFSLHLKRRASFYIFNLLIPCMMISFLAPLGFYLPADSGEKVSLGVTVLLALTVFQLLVAESMPPSESVPLIGKYYIATMTMVTASTALTIFIMNIHHCGPEARPVPQWAERLILNYLARICFVYEVGENCLGGATSRKQPLSEEESEARAANNSNPKGTNWDVNGQVWAGRVEEDGAGESMKPGRDSSNQTEWTEDMFVTIDHSEEEGAAGGTDGEREESACGGGGEHVEETKGVGGEEAGRGSAGENRREIFVKTVCVCQHQGLRKNIEYIANSYQDQRAAQLRIGEWRKVAKVMDRFFMWLFFIMVFFMSILILGKAI
ncbi:hypothetical protein F7725_006415 [Dissostichus mawsoni]|uniref:Uncharacterized protein n=1 Tax=Dissostichus mawsoni TaxID=36200 RepID=A0A7J5XUT6_DISMA|nr:hypothetical protein F7725_006415 [Dissostichus mawsoni]